MEIETINFKDRKGFSNLLVMMSLRSSMRPGIEECSTLNLSLPLMDRLRKGLVVQS